jgi:hypothetical protein
MTNAEVFLLISNISMRFIENKATSGESCGQLAEATIEVITEQFGEEGLAEFSAVTTKDAFERIIQEFTGVEVEL